MLTRLWLPDKRINTLTQRSLAGLEASLSTFSVRFNNVQTIDRCTFHRFSKLSQLYLGENPWICDCKLQWILNKKELIQTSRGRNSDYGEALCSDGRALLDLESEDFDCSDDDPQPVCQDLVLPDGNSSVETPIALDIVSTTSTSLGLGWSVSSKHSPTEFRINCSGVNHVLLLPDHTRREYQLTGLQPDTTYHVCLQAVVSNGVLLDPVCVDDRTKSTHGGLVVTVCVSFGIILMVLIGAALFFLVHKRHLPVIVSMRQLLDCTGHTDTVPLC
jgi:hypothetical protein